MPDWLRQPIDRRVQALRPEPPRSNVRVLRVNLGNPWRFVPRRLRPYDWAWDERRSA